MALWLLTYEVTADDERLKWRKLHRWRSVGWVEVTDYYDKKLPKVQQRTVIETSAGSVWLSKDWTNHEVLRVLVQQKARRARAKEWGLIGTRPEDDWPQVFFYDAKEVRKTSLFFGTALVVLIALSLYQIGPKAIRILSNSPRSPGREWELAALTVMVIMMFCYPAMFLPLWLPVMLETRRHRGERITASLEGIIFEDDKRRIAASWNDVTDYFAAPLESWIKADYRFVVVTRHATFEFIRTLKEAGRLRQIIDRYAQSVSVPG